MCPRGRAGCVAEGHQGGDAQGGTGNERAQWAAAHADEADGPAQGAHLASGARKAGAHAAKGRCRLTGKHKQRAAEGKQPGHRCDGGLNGAGQRGEGRGNLAQPCSNEANHRGNGLANLEQRGL